MVLVLPNNERSTQRFAGLSRLAQGTGNASQQLLGAMQGKREREQLSKKFGEEFKNVRNPELQKLLLLGIMEKQAKQAEFEKRKNALEKIKQSPFWEKASDIQKQAIESEILGELTGGTAKSLVNFEREQKDRDAVAQALQGFNTSRSSQSQPNIQTQEQERNFEDELNQARSFLASGSQSLQNIGKSQIEEIHREQDLAQKKKELSQKEREFEHKETSDYAKNLAENYSNAQEIKSATKEGRKAVRNKATGISPRNVMFKYLSDKKSPYAGLFQTKDTQAIISSTKALSGGFKKLFGGRPTEREFFWYENILPDLLKSGEVNEQIFDYFDRSADLMLKAQDEYDKIVKKNKGYRPIDIDVQVRDKLKPEIDKLISEGEQLSGYVLMRFPDGSVREVPKSEVSLYPEGEAVS